MSKRTKIVSSTTPKLLGDEIERDIHVETGSSLEWGSTMRAVMAESFREGGVERLKARLRNLGVDEDYASAMLRGNLLNALSCREDGDRFDQSRTAYSRGLSFADNDEDRGLAHNNIGASYGWEMLWRLGSRGSDRSEWIKLSDLNIQHLDIARTLLQRGGHRWWQSTYNRGKDVRQRIIRLGCEELARESVELLEAVQDECLNPESDLRKSFPNISDEVRRARDLLQKVRRKKKAAKFDNKDAGGVRTRGNVSKEKRDANPSGEEEEGAQEKVRTISDEPDEQKLKREFSPRSLGEAIATASLGKLIETFLPPFSKAAIARLTQLIKEAQKKSPKDKETFVRDVNALLNAHHLRLRDRETGEVFRLSFKNGSIQIGLPRGAFRNRDLEIVFVGEEYGVGRRPRDTSSAPKPPS